MFINASILPTNTTHEHYELHYFVLINFFALVLVAFFLCVISIDVYRHSKILLTHFHKVIVAFLVCLVARYTVVSNTYMLSPAHVRWTWPLYCVSSFVWPCMRHAACRHCICIACRLVYNSGEKSLVIARCLSALSKVNHFDGLSPHSTIRPSCARPSQLNRGGLFTLIHSTVKLSEWARAEHICSQSVSHIHAISHCERTKTHQLERKKRNETKWKLKNKKIGAHQFKRCTLFYIHPKSSIFQEVWSQALRCMHTTPYSTL